MIKSKVTALVAKAFDTKLSDAVTYFTLKSIDSSGNFKSYKSRGVFENYTAEEVARSDGAILFTDTRVTLLQDELAIDPKVADRVETNTETFRIENFSKDPTDSIWELQARL